MECKDKILFVVDSLNKGSGVTSVVMNIFRHSSNKYDFFILFNNKPENFEDEVLKKGAIIFKTQQKTNFSFLVFILNTIKIAKECAKNYKIIHIHSIQFSIFILFFFKIYNRNLKFIVHSHNTKIGDSLLKSIRNFLFVYPVRFLFKNKVACSLNAYEGAFGCYQHKKPIIIYNAIDYSKFSNYSDHRNSIREKYNFKKNHIVLGHIGRFDQQKNHKFLLKIFEAILTINKNYLLCLVGEGNFKNSIISQAKKMNLYDNIIFMPPTSKSEEYYSAFDLFLFPSLFEGFPLTLQEAQASGLKCIISDTISNEGLIFPICKSLSLKNGINEWIEEVINSRLDQRMEYSKLYKAKGICLEKEIIKLETLYNSI